MASKDHRRQEEEEKQRLGQSGGGAAGDESPVLGIPLTPAQEHEGVEISATAEPLNTDGDGAEDEDDGGDDDDQSEFEFSFGPSLPTITAADEIFSDGRIRPVYPVFDQGLFLYYQSHEAAATAEVEDEEQQQQRDSIPLRLPLRDLIMQQQQQKQQQRPSTTASTSEVAKPTRTSVDAAASTSAVRLARSSSFSSSDADDLDGVPAGTYCVWTPGSVPPSPDHLGKKSRSTGSTGMKRWSLRDLVLGRSHSDGRHKLMFFHHQGGEAGEAKTASNNLEEEKDAKGKKSKDNKSTTEHKKAEEEKKKKQGRNNSSTKDHPKASTTGPNQRKKKPAAVAELDLATAHRLYYSNEALKSAGGAADGQGRRRSLTFLPYRKDLFVGIFPHSRSPGRGVGLGYPQSPSSSFYGF